MPIFLKIAPDLDAGAGRRHRRGAASATAWTASIATNTTVSRDAVKGLPHAEEAGGLSGAPVLEASNRVIGQLRAALGQGFPIIGVGGIMSAADAVSKIRAGADLVQIYTGLIYRGPRLVSEAARAIQATAPRSRRSERVAAGQLQDVAAAGRRLEEAAVAFVDDHRTGVPAIQQVVDRGPWRTAPSP